MRQDALSLLCSHDSFFLSCPKSSDPTHSSHSSREVQRNHFDLTTGESMCAVCLSLEPEAQNTIQVRRVDTLDTKIDPRVLQKIRYDSIASFNPYNPPLTTD